MEIGDKIPEILGRDANGKEIKYERIILVRNLRFIFIQKITHQAVPVRHVA